jgi:phospholipase/carboxylesterase
MRTARAYLTVVLLVVTATGCAGCPERRRVAEPEYVEVMIGDPAPGQSVPLIFGLHGFGDRPEMFGRLFASEFPIAARLVFPRGVTAEGEGFSWFPIPVAGQIDSSSIVEGGVRDAGERIAVLIERLADEHPLAGKPVVFGYSQGGILSFYLAAQHPELVTAVVPLAGFLPASLLGTAVPAATYAFHGAEDELIPVEAARATVRAFVDHGGIATLVEYPRVRHQFGLAQMRAVRQKVVDLAVPAS